MLWSGSASRTVVRDSVWGLMMFAGAAWLAIGWCVLRLTPPDVVAVASAVLFFGALCEVVRALVGMSTWWLNAGLAVLFGATGAVVLADRGETYSTPLSLVAWFLLVRGAVDVAVSVMNRGVDRTWGLVLTLGLAQAGLGFYAATPQARVADPVILTLGALSVLRGLADLTTSLRLREVAHAQHDVLALPPERQAGVTGYAAGLADYPAAALPDYPAVPTAATTAGGHPGISTTASTPGGSTTAANIGGHPGGSTTASTAAGQAGGVRAAGTAAGQAGGVRAAGTAAEHGEGGAGASGVGKAAGGAESAGGRWAAKEARHRAESFHDEVVRTTADLDSMIKKAGVTGTGAAQHRVPEDLPSAPDTPEGAAESAAAATKGGKKA